MWPAIAVKNNHSRFLALALPFVVAAVYSLFSASHAAAQSTVAATVCATQSAVMIAQPASDSVVDNTTIPMEGTVNQASQLEIRIDGAFDSIIPLSIGQTSFTGSVQVAAGTHTITVTALNICAGPNGTASAVVTYTPPATQTPSTSESTPATGGVSTAAPNSEEVPEQLNGLAMIGKLLQPLDGVAQWLNIDTGNQNSHVSGGMPLARAVGVMAGIYLAVVGLAPVVTQWVSALPLAADIFSSIPAAGRPRFVMRLGRVIGLLVILGMLFL